MLFGLALVFNVNFSSAAAVNHTTNNNIQANSMENVGVNISASNLPKVSTTNKKNPTVNSITKPKYNSTMAAGALVKVNGLTLTQMKDGLSRAQTFFNKNKRLPSFINFGTRKIPIATFKKNLATQGLKINITIVSTTKTTTNTTVTKPNTSSVTALAASLKAGSTSQYNTAVKIFNWVRDNITYSFYYNTKYGANGTLTQRTGNCVDTSHLLVALSRSAGITARYIHGTCQFSSGTWYGHVWTQLYINGKWMNADAISYRNSFGVINNWNTATYKLNGIYTTLPF